MPAGLPTPRFKGVGAGHRGANVSAVVGPILATDRDRINQALPASVRHYKRSLRGCLRPDVGWISLYAAVAFPLLLVCKHWPVNAYASLRLRQVTRILPVSITDDEGRSGKGDRPRTCRNHSPKSHVYPPTRPDFSSFQAIPIRGRLRDGSGQESAALGLVVPHPAM
jgi:hypothetical protein